MEIDGQQSNPGADTLNELAQINSGEADPSQLQTPEAPVSPDQQAQGGPENPLDAQPPENNSQVQEHPAAESVTPEAPAAGGITYDGQTFATEKEAYEYMQTKLSESETEKAIMQARQDAYEQAITAVGQPQAPVPEVVAQPQDDFDEEAYYSDPVGYTKQRESKLAERIRADLKRETDAAQADQQAWSEFFAAHPDLDGFKQDCEMVLNQNREAINLLARKDKKQAMNFLATKTREKFQTWAERQKPRETLPNTTAGPSSGNSGSGVTPTQPQEDLKSVDFCSEFNNIFN